MLAASCYFAQFVVCLAVVSYCISCVFKSHNIAEPVCLLNNYELLKMERTWKKEHL